MLIPPRLFLRRRRRHHLCLSHATMRIHFSLIAGISGNKGNESAASYGLIHQELIEASLVSSADRVGVVLECSDLCAFKCSCDTFFLKAFKWLRLCSVRGKVDREKMHRESAITLRNCTSVHVFVHLGPRVSISSLVCRFLTSLGRL